MISDSEEGKKIFIYLRFGDSKKTFLKSQIREFAALRKLLPVFIQSIWEKFGYQFLNFGNLEYIDSNTEIVLISFSKDFIKQQFIISGIIPEEYQSKMLDENFINTNMSMLEIISKLNSIQKTVLTQKQQKPNILSLIKNNINEYGEFYIIINSNIL